MEVLRARSLAGRHRPRHLGHPQHPRRQHPVGARRRPRVGLALRQPGSRPNGSRGGDGVHDRASRAARHPGHPRLRRLPHLAVEPRRLGTGVEAAEVGQRHGRGVGVVAPFRGAPGFRAARPPGHRRTGRSQRPNRTRRRARFDCLPPAPTASCGCRGRRGSRSSRRSSPSGGTTSQGSTASTVHAPLPPCRNGRRRWRRSTSVGRMACTGRVPTLPRPRRTPPWPRCERLREPVYRRTG